MPWNTWWGDACVDTRTGGWMRVAYIDMRNTSHQCPSGLTLFSRSSPPRRVCNITSNKCVSTTFTVHGIEYSHVYGRIIAYQNRVPIVFHYFNINNNNYDDIDEPYVYGVSLTHSQSPHKHLQEHLMKYYMTQHSSVRFPEVAFILQYTLTGESCVLIQ